MPPKANINSDDYYEVLGVGRKASDADLAKAYRKLALKHHPDKNPDRKEQAEEEFKKLNEAYDVLRSPEKRNVYDHCGRAGLDGSGGNPQADEFGSSFRPGAGPSHTTMSREEADEIFQTFFGGKDPFASMFGDADCQAAPFMFQTAGPSNTMSGSHGFVSTDTMFEHMHFGNVFPGAGSTAGLRFGANETHRSEGRAQPDVRPRSKRAQSRRAEMSKYSMPSGTAVIIQGLTKSPEHNDKVGKIVQWDGMKARYEVQLASGGCDMLVGHDKLWLRAQNIRQLCRVEVTGLLSKLEINGRSGEVCNYDCSKHRYLVRLEGYDSALSLQPANCILSPGTCVVMNGLAERGCNGQRACIISIDRAASRYIVERENGKRIKIKFENVLC